MREMTFLDLFAGIGGGRRGFEKAGHRCVGYCEKDKFARASYRAMHCMTEWQRKEIEGLSVAQRRKAVLGMEIAEEIGEDIREIEEVPIADCWVYGAPCKSFSNSGKREGLDGESGLVREVYRLLQRHKPEWLVYENVTGMFATTRGLDFLWVLSEMDKCGYDARWQTLNTRDFGLPHNRERVYVIGHCREYGEREIPIIRGEYKRACCRDGRGIKIKESTKQGYAVAHEGDSVNFRYPNSRERRGRVGHKVAQCLTATCEQAYVESVDPVVLHKLTPLECFRLQGWEDEYFYRAKMVNSDSRLYEMAGNGMSIPVMYEIAKRLSE